MSRGISIILLLCVQYHFVFCFVFEDCGSERGSFKDVSITGCDVTDERCALVRGTNSTISATLIPNTTVSYIKAKARCKKGKFGIRFHVNSHLLCNNPDSGLICPIFAGDECRFSATMHVQFQINIDIDDVNFRWEFEDKYERRVICIKFPGRLLV